MGHHRTGGDGELRAYLLYGNRGRREIDFRRQEPEGPLIENPGSLTKGETDGAISRMSKVLSASLVLGLVPAIGGCPPPPA